MSNPQAFYQSIQQLSAQRADPTYGFFGPQTLVWQVNRERINYLGGLRAILMQLAHPAVAQGVADHSNFQQDPLGRFVRTMSVVQDILFGPTDIAIKAATRVYAKHARVKGILSGSLVKSKDAFDLGFEQSPAPFDYVEQRTGEQMGNVPLRSGCYVPSSGGIESPTPFDYVGYESTGEAGHFSLRSGCSQPSAGKGEQQEYSALDPELLLWVYATLIDSLMFIHDEILPPLGEEKWARLYDEGRPFAYLFGVPDAVLPPTLDAFRSYVRGMVNTIKVTDTAREMARAVIRSPHPVFGVSNTVLAAGTVPDPLREAFGLPWNAPVRAGYALGMGFLRVTVPLLPGKLRRHQV
ncbi:MAG: DUF2236 domain-containing protein [Anaerolineales bacterium]|nr:DUF2236 domain-containing protein [Anaerolineales bacterium]